MYGIMYRGIIKGVGVKGYGVILILDLNVATNKTANIFHFTKLSDLDIL